MKKLIRPSLLLVALLCVGARSQAEDWGMIYPNGGGGNWGGTWTPTYNIDGHSMPFSTFANTGYGAQIGFDSFRYSVRKRMEMMRTGALGQPLGLPFGGGSSSRPAGGGYSSGGVRDPYANQNFNPGGGYYNQNYNQNWNPPANTYNQNWDTPALPNPGYNYNYNAPSSYNPYGGTTNNVNTNWNNETWGQQVISQPYSYNGSFASDSAYAMAPSSRSSYSSNPRRQLDCVYYSGFTVWADLYQTWSKQNSRSRDEGYKYRTFGPAIGFDWTNGPITWGAAMTYNWGRLKANEISHSMKQNTWAVDFYGQYNTDNWYINGSLGFAHNRYKSDRDTRVTYRADGVAYNNMVYNYSSFSSNSWNIDFEYGWKYLWNGVQVVPNIGFRYFHDNRGEFVEEGGNLSIYAGSQKYNVFEIPIGVNFAYEYAMNGMIFVPRAKLAYIPELGRKNGSWSGAYRFNSQIINGVSEGAPERNRHGFLFGLGVDARISKSLSAHLDYNVNFRSRQYEHHWNLGAAFTF